MKKKDKKLYEKQNKNTNKKLENKQIIKGTVLSLKYEADARGARRANRKESGGSDSR